VQMETEDTAPYMYEVIKVTLPPAYSSLTSTATAISTTSMYINFQFGSCFSIIQNRRGRARMHHYQILIYHE
jgi:hypothetical protein